ncbi:MAG: DEAD/DEAH box helicase [Methanothrix sp.]|nr:DEAD/DEAH box helicase [Methanothrix sp.]
MHERRSVAQSFQAEARHLVEDVSQIEERFPEFFRTATYDDNSQEGHNPYPFQTRLATAKELPELIDIPTGLGKTDAVVLAWLWRRRFASQEARAATPRRLVYCLPMRTLVEQTAGKAKMWMKNPGIFVQRRDLRAA